MSDPLSGFAALLLQKNADEVDCRMLADALEDVGGYPEPILRYLRERVEYIYSNGDYVDCRANENTQYDDYWVTREVAKKVHACDVVTILLENRVRSLWNGRNGEGS